MPDSVYPVASRELSQRRGATEQEIIEAIWVAAEMRAGGAYAHSVLALDALGPAVGGAAGPT